MECNKDDAVKARDRASRCLTSENYSEAKRFVLKAQRLYPDLAGLPQLLAIAEVHCKPDAPWYEVLQVERDTEEETVKKQYRKLLLLLHPDKNVNTGAASAFKLVKDAFDVFEKEKASGRCISRDSDVSNVQNEPVVNNAFVWSTCTKCCHSSSYPRTVVGQYVQCPQCLQPFLAENVSQEHDHPGTEPSRRKTCCLSAEAGSSVRVLDDFTSDEENSVAKEEISSIKKERDVELHEKEIDEASKEQVMGIQEQEIDEATKEYVTLHKQEPRKEHCSEEEHCGKVEHNVQRVGEDLLEKYEDRSAVGLECTKKKQKKEEAELHKTFAELPGETLSSPLTFDNGKESVEKFLSPVSADRGKRPMDEITGINNEIDSSSSSQDLGYVNGRSGFSRIETRNQKRRRAATINGEQLVERKMRKKITTVRSNRVKGEHPDGNFSPFGTNDFLNLRRELFENLKVHILSGFKGEGTQVVDVEWAEGSSSQTCHNKARVATEREYQMNLSIKYTIPDILDCGVMEEMPAQLDDLEDVPDNDVYNFEHDRHEESFGAGQIWAVYDDDDGLPRFYAYILEVCLKPFSVTMNWLYPADPMPRDVKKWVDAGLAFTCGEFEARDKLKRDSVRIFSHMMAYEIGKKPNVYRIYPQKGDVWALYNAWKPRKGKTGKCFPAFVVTDFSDEFGIEVVHLFKVPGYRSIYCRKENEPFKHIPTDELSRFSHQIPAHYLSGNELMGLPDNSFDLDLAALTH